MWGQRLALGVVGKGLRVEKRWSGGFRSSARALVDQQPRVGLVAAAGSPGSVPRDAGGGGGGLGLGLALDGWRGGGPRLTQQCLGAGWESLILPGNDGGPCLRPATSTASGAPCAQLLASPLPNLPPPPSPGGPFFLSGGYLERGGSWLAGCPQKGHSSPSPSPKPERFVIWRI